MIYGDVLLGELGLERDGKKEELYTDNSFSLTLDVRQPEQENRTLRVYSEKGIRVELRIKMEWDHEEDVYSAFTYQLFDRNGNSLSEIERFDLSSLKLEENERRNIVNKRYGRGKGTEKYLVSFDCRENDRVCLQDNSQSVLAKLQNETTSLENEFLALEKEIKDVTNRPTEAFVNFLGYTGLIEVAGGSIGLIATVVDLNITGILISALCIVCGGVSIMKGPGNYDIMITKTRKKFLRQRLKQLEKKREQLFSLDLHNADQEDWIDFEEDLKEYLKEIKKYEAYVQVSEASQAKLFALLERYQQQQISEQKEAAPLPGAGGCTLPFDHL